MLEEFIGIGIICSLLYYEWTDLSPGGLISPVYLALFIDQPLRIVGTIIIALVTSVFIKVLCLYLPIYGKRRFAIAVSAGILLKPLLIASSATSFMIIGNIIPGLIAIECDKQGSVSTITSLLIMTILLKGIMIVYNGGLVF